MDGDERSAGLRAFSLRDLDGLQFPPIQWAVDELIPTGSLSLMVGRPKAGKSLMAVDLLASVATGETFLDRATSPGPTVYVPAEDALPLVRNRLWTRLGSERDAPVYVVPADGSIDQTIRLDDAESFMALASVVDRLKPSILVLDPLVEMHRKKENDADEMAGLLRPLRQLAHETDVAVILIHHRNKYGSDNATTARGSSAITGGVDQLINLELSGDADDADLSPHRTMTIRVEGRFGPRQRLYANLQPGLRWLPSAGPNIDDLDVPGRIYRQLEMSDEPMTADDLVTACGSAKKSIQNALTGMIRAGHIRRQGVGARGAPYTYAKTSGRKDESAKNGGSPAKVSSHDRPKTTVIRPNGAHDVGIVVCTDCGLPVGSDGQCPSCRGS